MDKKVDGNVEGDRMSVFRGKRAQMPGQIFVYILAIVIVGVIIVYGYNAIKDFSDRGDQVAFVSFKTSFENTVKAMVSDYGTIKRPDFEVPPQYERVCVVDFSTAASGGLCAPTSDDYEPIVCSGWKQGASQKASNPDKDVLLPNVFLTPDGSESFHVGNIKIPATGYSCSPVRNGKVNIQFKSVGDGVEATLY